MNMGESSTKIDSKNFVYFALKNKNRDQFHGLGCSDLAKFLDDDELLVKSEKEAFDALRNWIMHKPKERFADLPKLLPLIRLNQLETRFLKTEVKDFAVEGNCAQLIKWAIKRQNRSLDERDKMVVDFRTKPRKSATKIKLFALCSKEVRPRGTFKTAIKAYSTETKVWSEALISSSIANGHFKQDSCMYGKHHMIAYDEKLNVFYSLNLVTMTAEQLPRKLTGVEQFVMEVVDDVLYLFGHYMDGVGPGELYMLNGFSDFKRLRSKGKRFDFTTREWTQMAAMSTPRIGHCSAVLDGKIYAAGGFPTADFECYDPKTDEWTTCAPMRWQRINAQMAAHNGFLYVFGGFGADFYAMHCGVYKQVERYNPAENEWSVVAEMSAAMYGFRVISILDRAYLIGGEEMIALQLIKCGVNKTYGECAASKPYAVFDLSCEKFVDDSIPVMPTNYSWPFVGYYINE